MLKSSGAMGAATLTSRLLGMVREIVYARFMGDGPVAGAFVFAFMVPNLFRRLLGEGALTAAFIPIFKEKEQREGDQAMWRAASAVISGLLLSATATVIVVVLALSAGLSWFTFTPENRLMLDLLRLMFPYMLLVCLAAVFMAMLNARGFFFLPSLGASLLNVVMIASVFWLAPRLGTTLETQIYGLAFGVLLAGLAQAGFQLPALHRDGFRFAWVNPWKDETVRAVVTRMIPGTIGVAAFQLNVLVTQGIAQWVDKQIVASFNYAVRLMELPQGVFGISLATFLLPTLSGLATKKDYPEFNATLKQGLRHLVFVNLIASVGLCVLAEPIIRLLFQRGEFSPDATHRTAWALAFLAPGLISFSSVNILARAFYALGDTQTPMKISLFCLATNALASAWLVFPMRQGGLGLANTLTSFLNTGLLIFALTRKLKRLDLSDVYRHLWQLLPAAAAAGLVAWGVWQAWERWVGHEHLVQRAGAALLPIAAAGSCYLLLCVWLKNPSALEMTEFLRARLKRDAKP